MTPFAKLVDGFEIILQECSLGDPLPIWEWPSTNLLKQFGSLEQDGHQD